MTYLRNDPACNREDCFGYKNGKCVVLIDNNFGNRECPFYKNNDQINNTNDQINNTEED